MEEVHILHKNIEEFALQIRLNALKMTNAAKTSHIGSMFSIADIVAVLYAEVLSFKNDDPGWDERDRLILSKGHAGAVVYIALATTGFFDSKLLESYCQNGSRLSGHVSHKNVPGVEFSTGSLGHGLGVSAGRAYALKKKKNKSFCYTILSDGECDEGSIWEAAMFAAHHRLDNMVVIIDYNKLQSLSSVQETLELEPFKQKWESFNWGVVEVNGHNHEELLKVLSTRPYFIEKPLCIIAHTVKGKGVSFMENSVLWHYRTAQGAEFEAALNQLLPT